ncbi:MAG TPA: molybdopterin-dependent oxidoreductase [Acidobacteriota bacterium]|nr:molybdopterin-dependent oxidoreductase [Acidobacteriota bacterium]
MSTRTGICNFCGTGCGHFLQVEGGAVRGVFASPGHPVSRGRLCVRGWHIHELLATSERITTPLIRRGGRFEGVSYDEAVGEAAGRLSRYSGDEIGFLASPRASNEDNYLLAKLARTVFHSPNVGLASDQGHGDAAEVLLEGAGSPAMLGALTEVRKAKLILIVGSDIARLNPIVASEIHYAARGGADLVTLSSRRTQIARLSGKHLWLKPGSIRHALAAAAKVLVARGWQDAAFLGERADGFEEFARSLDGLDLAALTASTGLAPAEIEDLARRLSQAPSAMAFFTSGIAGLDRASVALLFDLFLAAGKIGRESCGVNPVAGISNIVGSYDVGASPRFLPGHRRAEGPAAGRTPRELLTADPTPLKALVVTERDEEIVRHTGKIKGLECLVYIGATKNPFADLAHVVLPAATFAEKDGTYTNTERRIQLNRRKIEPPPGVRPAWRVYSDIARARGAAWSYESPEDVLRSIAADVPAYSAVSYAGLEKGAGLQWPCDAAHPAGTVRLPAADAPRRLRFVPPGADFASPSPSEAFPFLLMAGKANYFWHRNNAMGKTQIPKREYNALLLLYPKGFVEVAASDAKQLGLRDRASVDVVAAGGSMRVSVRVSEDVKPGTVYVPYFIEDMVPGFLNASGAAIDEDQDSAIPVRIEKV